MRMRLAFSVAAHLEPGILLIDEAFAIGDAAFRVKCRQKIADFIRRGSSLLLVSHDTGVISDLCRRAILIEGGRMVADGSACQILERYERTTLVNQRDAIS
jgi:lipopolysaccharide transport system ATP-binding protein